MKTNRFVVAASLLVAAFALVAAGCGGGGKGGAGGGGKAAENQVVTVSWGAEPPSLDPGLATDTTSSNILLNIMDPLVKLDPESLDPVPSLAESWDVNGKIVTLHLRQDGRWTNGDPVTAHDFVYSWLRTLSPELGADYAYQFFGIKGAQEYNACKSKQACAALRKQVGVSAPNDYTLRIKLTSPQPWFVQQMAHHSFLAVHRQTVERYGDRWTEPENIVTDGPFKLVKWQHDARIDLAKWDGWRNADDVKLTRVNGRIITDGTTAVQAFAAGEIDVNTSGIPPADIPRLKQEPTYQSYPGLGTYYYGLNVKQVPDVNQRRAMAFAIDRQSIIDNIAQADQTPATSFTPKGMPGFDEIANDYLEPDADMAKAKQLMAQVANPVRNVNLFLNDAPGHKEIAVAVQDAWKELGISTTIKQMEWAQFLEFLGPPPNKSVDAYRLGWIGDYVDAINFLELWTCKSGNNNTNYCNPQFDRLISEARATADDGARYRLYSQAEDMLTGPSGDMPIIPIYWYTYTSQEKESVKDTFNINLLDQIDLTKVEVKAD